MAYREYIGSRYVPIFGRKGEQSWNWDNNAPYEPLTVVSYNGNTYTSRQYVPAGIGTPDNNPLYWAETGNYNAQIEQYRQEVQGFNARITELEDNEMSPISIKMFDGSGTNNYTCKLITCDGSHILIDTGALADSNTIANWLTSNGVTKLDALVLTHYHEDHYENYNSIISNFCDSETKIFEQMEPTESNNQYQYYVDYSNNVRMLLNSLGYNMPIVAVEGQSYTFGDHGKLTMTVYNTNAANRSAYDAAWANGGSTYYPGEENEGKSSLNNYSLVCRFECGNSSYVDTGDVEGAAQRYLAKLMQPATVALNPHHFYNKMGYEEFYDRLKPQFWLVSNHFATEAGDAFDTQVYTFRFNSSYLGRYVKFNTDDVNIITNLNSNVELHMMGGCVVNFSGHIVDQDYNAQESTITPHFACMLPPAIYEENPYFILSDDFTLQYLDDKVRKYYNYAAIPKSFYVPGSQGAYGADCPFAAAVRALWSPLNVASNVTLWLDNSFHWNFSYDAVVSPCNSLKIFSPTGNTPGNISFNYESKGNLKDSIEGSYANGATLPNGNTLNYLLRSSIIAVELASGELISCIRQSGYNSSAQKSVFNGNVISADGLSIIAVTIEISGVIRIRKITIGSGAVDTSLTAVKIYGIC